MTVLTVKFGRPCANNYKKIAIAPLLSQGTPNVSILLLNTVVKLKYKTIGMSS